MKRKQYKYYWETATSGCFNYFAAIMSEVGGHSSMRFYAARRKIGQSSALGNYLWSEWSDNPNNKGILFRITKKQFDQFQKTGKYPKDLELKN